MSLVFLSGGETVATRMKRQITIEASRGVPQSVDSLAKYIFSGKPFSFLNAQHARNVHDLN